MDLGAAARRRGARRGRVLAARARRFAINAIQHDDLPVVMGVTLFAAFFIVIANIVVDVLYAVVDPRVRSDVTSTR